MLKKSKMIIYISILCICVLFTGCSSEKVQIKTNGGLKIYSSNYGLESDDEIDLNKTKFAYTVDLTNENEKIIFIKSIQPSFNEEIKNKSISNEIEILNKEMIVDVNKEIKPSETIHISGEIVVDTKNLTKSDVKKLKSVPYFTDIKVSTEETIELQQYVLYNERYKIKAC